MRIVWALLLVAASVCNTTAQSSFFIRGTVVDDSTGTVLDGASVLAQNTTKGTITGKDGTFQLELPAGGHNLVISYAGYESEQVRVGSTQSSSSNLEIRLRKKAKNLEEVVVQATTEVPNGWEKYGMQFLQYFIGSTPFAKECALLNPEVLKFYFSRKRNVLKVKSEEPLLIRNEALGYEIRYQLDSFVYHYNTQFSGYAGVAFYTGLTGTAEDEQRWRTNRRTAYYGSRLHFMRSYYDSTLAENGFELEEVTYTDAEKKKPRFRPIKNPYDTAIYVVLEGNDKEINLFGTYRVVYKLLPMHRDYLLANKFPLSAKEQLSTLEISNGFVITENGFFYEQAEVINSGYWAWKNLADQLPYDYWPEEDEDESAEPQTNNPGPAILR
ncbi:MAG: carboxypeptidase-like regulatory domain-containing protein [Lacibacter sp.]